MIFFILYLAGVVFCGLASFALGRMSKGGALGLELARAVRQRDAMEALAEHYLEAQITAIEQMRTQQSRAERAEFELRKTECSTGTISERYRVLARDNDKQALREKGDLSDAYSQLAEAQRQLSARLESSEEWPEEFPR